MKHQNKKGLLRFQAGCHKKQLNLALVFLCYFCVFGILCILVFLFYVVSTSAIDYLERPSLK